MWELLCPGRTLVCVNTGDTAINAVKKLGGSINPLTYHNHGEHTSKDGGIVPFTLANGGGPINVGGYWYSAPYAFTGPQVMTTYTGDNTNHNNWQPFMAVYIWVRTS